MRVEESAPPLRPQAERARPRVEDEPGHAAEETQIDRTRRLINRGSGPATRLPDFPETPSRTRSRSGETVPDTAADSGDYGLGQAVWSKCENFAPWRVNLSPKLQREHFPLVPVFSSTHRYGLMPLFLRLLVSNPYENSIRYDFTYVSATTDQHFALHANRVKPLGPHVE